MSRTARLATAVATTLLALGTVPAIAGAADDAAIKDAVADGADWIESQQEADGTFNPGFSSFDPTATALAPAGRNAADVAQPGGPSLQDALFNVLRDPGNSAHPTNAAGYENAILSGYAAGLDPSRITADENLAADLASTYLNGYFGDTLISNVTFGALALSQVEAPRFLLDRTVAVIRANQHDDGGWNYGQSVTPDTQDDPSDVDLTGATMAALCDSGVGASDTAVQGALTFLKSKFDPATGGFVSFGSSNASTNGWVVSGLNACGIDPQGPGFDTGKTPIDYLLSLQDNSGTADDGAFEFTDPPNPFVPDGPDLPSSRDALRALAGGSFSSEPASRRPVDPVDDGVDVPVALAVDDGAGGVTFCRVTVPSGSSLEMLLATADGSSTPAGCASGAQFDNGELSELNGQTGLWVFNVDGGTETTASSQTVRFGDLIGLRRTGGPSAPGSDGDGGGDGDGTDTVGGGDAGGGGSGGGAGTGTSQDLVPAELQTTRPLTVASRSVSLSTRKRVVTVPLRCPKANRLCEGAVSLVYRKRRLARRAFLIAGGRTTKLRMKLSKRAMRRLGRSRRRVTVNLFSRDGYGIASRGTQTVTLTKSPPG